ncbi:hypothetical protein [Microbulbifer magnicolonia]|uniref:hypothetical protein n=1 Tax=Microbulbifer magnicolonia TaxID=3109744 RepID=UPI002B410710|nr:hypothetical protein [Microbulbifer sp. GG15]
MKHLPALGAAVAFIAAGSAYAATSVNIPLSGTLDKECNIDAILDGPFNNLQMDTTANQQAEQLVANCNYSGTATVTISSASGGFLVGPTNVGYTLTVQGLLPATQLVAPAVIGMWPVPVANVDAPRNLRINLIAPATVAGLYTDVLTGQIMFN